MHAQSERVTLLVLVDSSTRVLTKMLTAPCQLQYTSCGLRRTETPAGGARIGQSEGTDQVVHGILLTAQAAMSDFHLIKKSVFTEELL